jgi:hypothetical protein
MQFGPFQAVKLLKKYIHGKTKISDIIELLPLKPVVSLVPFCLVKALIYQSF